MKDLIKKTNRGFTIIEIMIVLAIAGLIMVIVFIAVPQLQRNQRDNARQSIANRIKAELETYAGNNQGLYPFSTTACGTSDTGKICDFVTRYISGKVVNKDPSTGNDVMTGASATTGQPQAYTAAIAANIPSGLVAGNFEIIYGAKCSGESVVASGTAAVNTRTYAVVYGLDRSTTVYCVDNG